MKDIIKTLGPFRWFLIICSLVLMSFAYLAMQWSDTIERSEKVTIYVAGSLVPIFFFLILFDMMMNRIQMAEKTPEQQKRFRQFTWVELIVLLLLTFSWLPFFNTVLS
jgi:hypothetical protein